MSNNICFGNVIPERLNVRAQPSLYADVLDVLGKGTRLKITDTEVRAQDSEDIWLKIMLGRKVGYVMAKFVNIRGN